MQPYFQFWDKMKGSDCGLNCLSIGFHAFQTYTAFFFFWEYLIQLNTLTCYYNMLIIPEVNCCILVFFSKSIKTLSVALKFDMLDISSLSCEKLFINTFLVINLSHFPLSEADIILWTWLFFLLHDLKTPRFTYTCTVYR